MIHSLNLNEEGKKNPPSEIGEGIEWFTYCENYSYRDQL